MQDGNLVLALALPAREWALHRRADGWVELDGSGMQFLREFQRPQPLRVPLERFVERIATGSGDCTGAVHRARACVMRLRAARVLIPDGFPGSELA
jgi:hypothetical protein